LPGSWKQSSNQLLFQRSTGTAGVIWSGTDLPDDRVWVDCDVCQGKAIWYHIVSFTIVDMVILVSRRAIDALFDSFFLLTDIRVLLRETAPRHTLDERQKEKVRSLLDALEQRIAVLREELAR